MWRQARVKTSLSIQVANKVLLVAKVRSKIQNNSKVQKTETDKHWEYRDEGTLGKVANWQSKNRTHGLKNTKKGRLTRSR